MNTIEWRLGAAVQLLTAVNANLVAKVTGYHGDYVLVSDAAPETYDELVPVYRWARECGAPLPVSRAGLEGSIYPTAHDNAVFRAAHDSLHVAYGYRFTFEGETNVALLHLACVGRYAVANGYDDRTLRDALVILWLDTYGQAAYHAETGGGFLAAQREWVAERFAAYVAATTEQ